MYISDELEVLFNKVDVIVGVPGVLILVMVIVRVFGLFVVRHMKLNHASLLFLVV